MEWGWGRGGGCFGRWGCECIFITSPLDTGEMVVVDQQAPLTDDDNTSSSGLVVLSCDVFESNNVR